jgi:multidrug resistance efflux pump
MKVLILMCAIAMVSQAEEASDIQSLRAKIKVQILESERLRDIYRKAVASKENREVVTAKFRAYQAQISKVAALQAQLPPQPYQLKVGPTKK